MRYILTFFIGGMFALASYHFYDDEIQREKYLWLGNPNLIQNCGYMVDTAMRKGWVSEQEYDSIIACENDEHRHKLNKMVEGRLSQ